MEGGPDEGNRVAILFQDLSQVALLLLQVVLYAGDTPSPVEQTLDQTSYDVVGDGTGSQGSGLCGCGLSIDGDV